MRPLGLSRQELWSAGPDRLIAGIKRNPRLVLRFEFGVVAVGRVWFRLDSGCRSPV